MIPFCWVMNNLLSGENSIAVGLPIMVATTVSVKPAGRAAPKHGTDVRLTRRARENFTALRNVFFALCIPIPYAGWTTFQPILTQPIVYSKYCFNFSFNSVRARKSILFTAGTLVRKTRAISS